MKIVKILFVIIAAGLLLGPSVLSTKPGTKLLNRFLPSEMNIQRASLGWISGVDIEGITFRDSKTKLTCERFRLKSPLYKLLFSVFTSNVGNIELFSPQLHLKALERQKSSEPILKKEPKSKKEREERKEKPSTSKESPSSPSFEFPRLYGKLVVHNAKVGVIGKKGDVDEISDINCSVEQAPALLSGNLRTGSSKAPADNPIAASFSVRGRKNFKEKEGEILITCTKIHGPLLSAIAGIFSEKAAQTVEDLFGDALSCSLKVVLDKGEVSWESDLQSNNLCSQVLFSYQHDRVLLKKCTPLSGTLPSSLLEPLARQFNLPVTKVQDCSLLIKNTKQGVFDLLSRQFLSPIRIQWETKQPLTFSINRSTPIEISANGLFIGHTGEPTASCAIDIQSEGKNAQFRLNTKAMLGESGNRSETKISAQGSWAEICAPIFGKNLSPIIGSDLTYEMNIKGEGLFTAVPSFHGDYKLGTETISNDAQFSFDRKGFYLKRSSFSLSIPLRLGKKQKAQISGTINSLSFPFVSWQKLVKHAYFDVSTSIEIPELSRKGCEFSTAFTDGMLICSKKDGGHKVDFLIKGTLPLYRKGIEVTEKNGLKLKVKGSANLYPQRLEIHSFETVGENLFVNIRDFVYENNTGTISSSSRVVLRLKNELIQKLIPGFPFSLQVPTDLVTVFSPISLSLDNGKLSGSKISAQIQSDEIHLSTSNFQGTYRIHAPLCFEIASQKITCSPSVLDQATKKPLVKGNVSFELPKKSWKENTYKIALETNSLPSTFVDPFFPCSDLLGDHFNARVNLLFSGISAEDNHCNLSAHFPKGELDINCTFNQSRIQGGSSPLSAKILLSQNTLERIAPSIRVKDSVDLRLALSKCDIDISDRSSLWNILSHSTLSANAASSSIRLENSEDLPSLNAKLDLVGEEKAVDFSINSAQKSSGVFVQGSCTNAWNMSGLTPSEMVLTTDFSAQSLPCSLLDLFANTKRKSIQTLFGPSLSVQGKISAYKMQEGSGRFELESEQASAHIDTSIKNGVLSLNSPATLQFTISEKVGKKLLKPSLFSTRIHSETPITIRIEPEGASARLSPFSLASITLPRIAINPGKFSIKNTGLLKTILALLRQEKMAARETMDFWSTPIFLSMRSGVLTCSRMDALIADTIHVGAWGEADLIGDSLNFIVMLPVQTLKAINLPMIVNPERGLQIPVTGTLSNPNVNTTVLTAKIAGSKLTSKKKRSNKLNMIGEVLQAAASLAETSQPVPPPTTTPFPWEK